MSSNSTSTEQVLRRPLAAGEQVTYWHLGATAEARYDVADQPMQGEMDPFFFLTKHKNFIPHEYPCRTQFISEFRDKRPTPTTTYSPARVWMPFGAPRVDLSGFWFRPTRLETWAVTTIDAKSAGKAQFRLSTCGGAILFVNGKEVGWMAPYGRNLETGKLFDVDLIAGANEFRVYFDDLAERDARYFFKLDLISGPTLEQALPVPVAGSIAANIEAMLDDMRFEHPYYDNGQVALITAAPLPVAADVTVAVEGDFMSIEAPRVFKLSLAAGANRLPIAETNDLPADFRHFKVSVHVGGLTVVRTFGVEISHQTKQGAAPATLEARIREALDAVSEEAEADSVRALARLATGRIGVETDAMACCPRSKIATTAPISFSCRCSGAGSPMPDRLHQRLLPAWTRPSSAIATGWMSAAMTCNGISPKTTRCSSTPPAISRAICCRQRRLFGQVASDRTSRRREPPAYAAGSITSRTGRWPSSIRLPISRSI